MYRVFVLEDDQATLEHIVDKVNSSPEFRVVATASSLEAAHVQLRQHPVDIVLVDLQLPDGDSFELIHQYTDQHPTRPILVISVFGDEQRVVKAISAGARGYLLKDDTSTQISSALNAVMAGQSPISPAIATHLVKHFHRANVNQPQDNPLSEREFEVLQLAAKGLSYREVAQMLDVTLSTVGTYTMRIYTKLAVHSRAEALFEARKLGLMDD